MSGDLARNLRFLCAERPSAAEVCRDIGINQQQFSKYLTGRARPSPHNMRRIAQYFEIEEEVILGAHAGLVQRARRHATSLAERRRDPLANAFPGDLARLRPYLGAYQVFFRSPAAPDKVVINAIFLDERNGVVYSRLIEKLRDTSLRRSRWTRCDGKAGFLGGRVFVVDNERQNESALSMYILTPPHRQKMQYLVGSMTFLASLPRRTPYASKVVWKRFESYRSVRELLETCGVYAPESLTLDPVIRTYLAAGFEDQSQMN